MSPLSCSERLVLAVTDWPGPLSLPWLPVSGLLVSVWVSSCRLFVDREGEVWGWVSGGQQTVVMGSGSLL